jgi:hypothetical protein
MLRSQPELCRDLIAAAALFRYGLEAGFPVRPIEVGVDVAQWALSP